MALRLEELLTKPPMLAARPEVVVDGEPPPVQWVHTSEIFEIGPLLTGGEVLLTSGLGLVGRGDQELDAYAARIAASRASALVLELGRSFRRPPAALVAACRRESLTLVVLHVIVPWVTLARALNERILDHEAAALRRSDHITAALTEAILEGQPLPAIIATLSSLVGSPVRLTSGDGTLVAGEAPGLGATHQAAISLFGQPWGSLAIDDTGDANLEEITGRAAVAVQLALLQTTDSRSATIDARRALALDLASGRLLTPEAILRRAQGLAIPTEREMVAVMVLPSPGLEPRRALPYVEQGLEDGTRLYMIADTAETVIAVVAGEHGRRDVGRGLLRILDESLGQIGQRVRHVGVGRVVPRLVDLPASFDDAQRTVRLAQRLPIGERWLSSTESALYEFLASVDDIALEHLVNRVLGPIVDHDARYRRTLLPTLIAYLAGGRSKTEAARVLGVRRQTIYQRLERLSTLLDIDTDDPAHATSLHVACIAWQLRNTSGITTMEGGTGSPGPV